ncbi:Similar to Pacsin2: Protein kinase C and casein kinase substrate in neurons protein 2 (Mus musculus) [Cotesia congregata]|uniref:Similar to Pacsin2: Protein kinase C and casein kinase substrate in neurons protein 2 (Mus musculus) n=1 Tax=Cotesia congregata TaxID=51543 RepID=A0A8J2EBX9_COTCN|nr:Similar to Pacsin2: Protein kinase C and casein kinase substrate in neurons protein 2 (Mus musculus) [Cotesia congregata]
MSHHSDDNMLIATSDSFWEPGNYKRTTKRIEDGHKLCDSLIALVQERSEIEKNYAKALKAWSKSWSEKIEKGPEYGTTEAAWKSSLVESDRLCDLHLRVKENLSNDIVHQVKTWQKDTYHKAKLEYHNSCKTERTAANQERNASADSSLSPDQQAARGSDNVKKMQDRVQKTKEEVQKAKEKYEAALLEINQYNPKYMEDMTQVYEKCQEMEAQRLQFFKDVLFGIHKCLNISQDPVLPQIYEEFFHSINNADYEKDLKWWSNNHGVNMAMNWPQFEDYTEEFREIAKGNKSKEAIPVGSITLINQRPVGEDLHDFPPVNKARARASPRMIPSDAHHADGKTDTFESQSPSEKGPDDNTTNRTSVVSNGTTAKQESNPFDEEDWDEDVGEALVDTGEPGVPVRALYDYEGAEADELSFKQGEVFEKLEDEDEQGWCKGRKDGRVGLYPANYVDVISE